MPDAKKKSIDPTKDDDRAAASVDREPSAEPTPEDHDSPPVGKEDEPRGHPTSDRFHSEQAHKT
jgi:hypothetical protein